MNVVLYNQTISTKTVSILNIMTTVFEFYKNDTESVTLYSTKFNINTTCATASCFYPVTIVSNPDLSVTFGGLTTVMKYVNFTWPTYLATLFKVVFNNETEVDDSCVIKGTIQTPSASLTIANYQNISAAYLVVTNTSTVQYQVKLKREDIEYLEFSSTIN